MKNIIVLTFLFVSIHSFGQQKTLTNAIKKSTFILDKSQKRMSLKEFVETIYITSLNTFEGEEILINPDELNVVLINDSGQSESIKLKELNDISVDQLQSFEYKRDKITEALYGARGEKFGIVILQLK